MSSVAIRARGLTLHRPWPWAFTHADKRVENRKWRPEGMRGWWLLLHAGAAFDQEGWDAMREGRFGEAAKSVPAAHPSGVIVAVAKLDGVAPYLESDDPWAFGPFVWRLSGLVVLPSPVECRGFQKLWRAPQEALDAVNAQFDNGVELVR